jgi:site-specific recombinase XerD
VSSGTKALSTLKSFRTTRNKILAFVTNGSKVSDIALSKIKLSFASANLEIGIDGEKWIVKNRVKTKKPERIPLLPIALEIVERYKDHPYCENSGKLLPVNTNQRYNGYLKEIADLCGIKKHMTTHMARHTFATSVTLENDVPIETVSQMLGYKSIKTT